MKYALQALENSHAYLPVKTGVEREVDQAAHFLRQAIAEAEQPDLARVGEVGVWGDEREWVELTHIEIGNLWAESQEVYSFAKAIEVKLKEKNT
jgi:hypothetical protein